MAQINSSDGESSAAVRVTQVWSLAMCCRAPSIPEAQDLSRSSSNASSFASVVEEHENEAEDEYDTGLVGGDVILLHYQNKTCTHSIRFDLVTVFYSLLCLFFILYVCLSLLFAATG